jgi:hypothetical protein
MTMQVPENMTQEDFATFLEEATKDLDMTVCGVCNEEIVFGVVLAPEGGEPFVACPPCAGKVMKTTEQPSN